MTQRTHFTFRVDTWTPDGESIVERVAGVERDYVRVSPCPDAGSKPRGFRGAGWDRVEGRDGGSSVVLSPGLWRVARCVEVERPRRAFRRRTRSSKADVHYRE